MAAFHTPTLEAALAALARPAPVARQTVAKSTPEQMAAARAAAYATVRHDGLMAGERLVNGEVYVFNADSRDADIDALLAAEALDVSVAA